MYKGQLYGAGKWPNAGENILSYLDYSTSTSKITLVSPTSETKQKKQENCYIYILDLIWHMANRAKSCST